MLLELAEYNHSLCTSTNNQIIKNKAMLEDLAQVTHSAYGMPAEGFRNFAMTAAC